MVKIARFQFSRLFALGLATAASSGGGVMRGSRKARSLTIRPARADHPGLSAARQEGRRPAQKRKITERSHSNRVFDPGRAFPTPKTHKIEPNQGALGGHQSALSPGAVIIAGECATPLGQRRLRAGPSLTDPSLWRCASRHFARLTQPWHTRGAHNPSHATGLNSRAHTLGTLARASRADPCSRVGLRPWPGLQRGRGRAG